jgi:pyruvate/oxaloacetate carboxyltransferase
MSIIDDAVVKIQTHALALTSETIRSAPSKPVESADVLPLAIAYIAEGTAQADDYTTARLLLTVNVDFHFSRTRMKEAYTQLNNIIPEYLKRLAGDPTLGGTVDTIIYPISFTVGPAQWDAVVTQMVSFSIPLKFIETPTR